MARTGFGSKLELIKGVPTCPPRPVKTRSHVRFRRIEGADDARPPNPRRHRRRNCFPVECRIRPEDQIGYLSRDGRPRNVARRAGQERSRGPLLRNGQDRRLQTRRRPALRSSFQNRDSGRRCFSLTYTSAAAWLLAYLRRLLFGYARLPAICRSDANNPFRFRRVLQSTPRPEEDPNLRA